MKQVADILGVIWVISKHVHFSGKTRTLGYREFKEAGTAVGGKDVILFLLPLKVGVERA